LYVVFGQRFDTLTNVARNESICARAALLFGELFATNEFLPILWVIGSVIADRRRVGSSFSINVVKKAANGGASV
jgi:hypothetical protein